MRIIPTSSKPLKKRYLIALCLAIVPTKGSAQTITTFVVSGDPVPGEDSTFDVKRSNRVQFPRSLNSAGHILFSARLADTSGEFNGDRGIFRSDGVSIEEIARLGQTAPDGNGTFGNLNGPVDLVGKQFPILNDAGQIVFSAGLTDTVGGTEDNHAFFLVDGDAITQIVREGQPAPDGNGVISYLAENRPTLNNRGEVAFLSNLTGTTGGGADDNGIFLSDNTSFVQVARAGQQLLGGTLLAPLSFPPVLNDQGQVAFYGTISGGANTGTHILRTDGDAIVSLGGAGRAIPDENGVTIEYVWNFSRRLNEQGQMSFEASLGGTPGGAEDNYGLFLGDGTTLVQIARKGDPTPSGKGKFDFPTAGDINDSGQVVFGSILSGTTGDEDNYALFLGDGDSVIEIAREGETLPDGNGTFHQSRFNTYTATINNAGQIAFYADIRGDDGNRVGSGIFFFDPVTGLHIVTRTGDSFLGSTISYLQFEHPDSVGVPYDLPMNFNNRGQIAYWFLLDDETEGIARWEMPQAEALPLRVTDVSRNGNNLSISFEAPPDLNGWQIFGSTDLSAFSDDLTAGSQFSEPSPGNYRAIVPIAGIPQSYYVQIKR